MWNEPYLETCCRSALHRVVLTGPVGPPGRPEGRTLPAAAGRHGPGLRAGGWPLRGHRRRTCSARPRDPEAGGLSAAARCLCIRSVRASCSAGPATMPWARSGPSSRSSASLPDSPIAAFAGPGRIRRDAAQAPNAQDARMQQLDAPASVEHIEAFEHVLHLARRRPGTGGRAPARLPGRARSRTRRLRRSGTARTGVWLVAWWPHWRVIMGPFSYCC